METGIIITPRTREDAHVMRQEIAKSDYYAEWDSSTGSFFFPEEEETMCNLEMELDNLFSGSNVNYRVEGVWK